MGRQHLTPLVIVAAAAGLASLGHPSGAAAGAFTINTCGSDAPNYSTQAFEDFATRGMMWKRACDPEGSGLRGLVTGNVVRSGRVARGARSYFTLTAPPGTYFAVRWSGHGQRRDCRYALQVWADGPGAPTKPIKNVRANSGCPRPGRAQAAGWPGRKTEPIPGTTRFVQRAVCVGAPGVPYCSARGRNFIRTLKAEITVVDPLLPSVQILQDTAFTLGQWVRGEQTVNYDAADNVGVKVARAVVGGAAFGEHWRGCYYAQQTPCPNGPGAIRVDTGVLGEGTQTLAVTADDAAENVAASTPVTVRVDNTAPGVVPLQVEGGDAWRNQNDFDLTWENPDVGDRAPIASAHYRLCRADGNGCADGSQSGAGIRRLADLHMPAPGEWQLRLWREDAAGNQEPANASVPVTLRFDPEPPQLGFEPPPASDPTLVSVLVTDQVSGLAAGQIELSREGSGVWQGLPTKQESSRLLARIDDAALPPGTYLLRATARDHAANQNSTDKWVDGRPVAVNLPLRMPTALRAGVIGRRTERTTVERGGKRRRVRREVPTFEPSARVSFGRQVTIGGRLENRDGQPLPDAEVQILSRSATSPEQLVGALRTDAQGSFTYVTPASSTRTLRFVYHGTPLTLPTASEVSLFVPAASSIRARPRHVRNGQAVHFVGRLRSLPPPATGKLIELQVVLSGQWQTFRTTLTDAQGGWRVPYRFRRTCGVTRYRFRARLPAEAGYPFETGLTRPIRIKVRGRPCR
ncbi:MAG TPA: hypothetical protein VI122_18390 [Thermoleophilaceae bacterium]